MKKIYLLVGVTALVGSVFAQSGNTNIDYPAVKTTKHGNVEGLTKVKPSQKFETKGITIWSDEFTSAADWVFTNQSVPSGSDWFIETDPAAIPVAALSPFGSTTASNGYLMINSDAIGGSDGDNTPTIVQATNATPIDLTGYPFVSLTFEHNYRWWQDTRGVRVSGDNGATWTEFEITNNGGYPNDQNSENPTVELFDISSIAGDSSEVLVQFYYNDNDYWAWYWAVDDVKIVETDPYDLRNNGIYWGSDQAIGTRVPYFQVPLNQVAPVDLSGSVSNIGYEDQLDVIYTVDVTSEGFTSPSAIETVLAFETDTLDCAAQFTPPGLGTYVFDATVSSAAADATPGNNDITAGGQITVNDYTYARDEDVAEGAFAPDMDFEAGNMFDIWQTDDLTGIDVQFGTGLDVNGLEVFARVYSIDPNDGSFILVAETPIYNTEAGWEGSLQTFVFDNPVTLTAGEAYVAAVGSFSTGMSVGTSGDSPDQTSFLYGDLGTAGIAWYFTNSTPMVRMNFDPELSVNSIEANEFNLTVYPNPAQNSANVDFTLENASDVTFELTDLSGKSVYSISEKMSAGDNSIVVPTDALSNGVYMYTFSNGNAIITKKLVVNK
ncbi:MAG: hypothetical protein COA32_13470 [Fluviicola sp.]|nr:MAG: hypothetical protein COA32_13470 [Fluviicola sp.]